MPSPSRQYLRVIAVLFIVVCCIINLMACTGSVTPAVTQTGTGIINSGDLPPEAITTLQLIKSGGPFPYAKDGTVFHNYEKLLPAQPEGYYREYTVVTPGLSDRGARRIVAGSGNEFYYTDDHYNSFKLIVE